nr:unnamed protein product [Callosobruchus chinensis]
MQDEDSDKTTDHQKETIRDQTEEAYHTVAADPQIVIEANTNGNRLHEEIEPKTPIKLPNDLDLSGPSCDKDVVGDDASKVKEQDILCECESANYSTKGDEDSSCLNSDLRSDATSTENERIIIREITSATTSSLIITPPAKQSTISNDSVLEINCNSATISETQESGVTNFSFVVESSISSLNVAASASNNNVQEDGNLASLESLAKKNSFGKTINSQSKASNEPETPTNSRNIPLKSVKTDKNIRKTPLPKIHPDVSGSRLSRPGTAVAPKKDMKTSSNLLSNRNGGVRNTASSKYKLSAIKRTVESPSKTAQASGVRPYTSSSTYGRYIRKEINSSTQRAIIVPGARNTTNYRDVEGTLKPPSMIPKPRTGSINVQSGCPSSKIDLQRKDKPSDYNLAKDTEDRSKSSHSESDGGSIHSRISVLQSRLKKTTSMIRTRMDTNSILLPDTADHQDSIKDDPEPILPKTASATLKDLYKNIFEMKETAMRLSHSTTMVSQKEHMEKLLMDITEIQRIADKLLDSEASSSKINEPEVSGSRDATIKSNKSKDNKIVIKFTQLKDKQKKKEEEEASNQSDEGNKGCPGTTTDLETGAIEKVKTENSLKNADSMEGVFIPSQEPFIHNIEEEEESNGCPKDFTLRMDFVQGKVHFQSGKSPVNNFSIGPDLKFIEYPVDDKMSDIISIKPSTECSYGSQNRDEHAASYKSLKSTDSELFNVVNWPFLWRDATLGTVTRSCMTLRKERMMSMAIIARQVFKSMPQIPSLTYIQEENDLENGIRLAGSRKEEEKSCPPKRRDLIQCQQLAMIADEVE